MESTAVSSHAAHVSFQGTSSRTDNKDRIKEITLIRRMTVSVVYARPRKWIRLMVNFASPADIPNEAQDWRKQLSEQHRGLVKIPCGDTPDDRGSSGTRKH